MKFCAYCGKQLQDDEECNCRDAKNMAEAAANVVNNAAENASEAVQETAENAAEQTADIAAQAGDTAEQAAGAVEQAAASGAAFAGNEAAVQPAAANGPAVQPAAVNGAAAQPAAVNGAAAQPAAGKEKSGKKFPVGIVCGAAAAVAVIVIAIVLIVNLSGGSKVYKAVEKTFKDQSYLSKELSSFKYDGGKYGMNADFSVEGYKISAGMAVDKDELQVNAAFDDGDDIDVSVIVDLGKKELRAKLGGVDYKSVWVYDYTSDDKDDLEDLIGKDSLNAIDEALGAVYDALGNNSDSAKKYSKIAINWFSDIRFKKTDSKSIKVDGEKRDCKGYEATITGDDLVDLTDALYEQFKKDYPDAAELSGLDRGISIVSILAMLQKAGSGSGTDGATLDDFYDKLAKAISDIDDIELTVYIWKGELAGLLLEVNKEEAYVEFNGGDYRLQNFKLYEGKKSDGKVVLEGSGKTRNDSQSFELTVSDSMKLTYSYDRSNDKFEAEIFDYDYWYGDFKSAAKVKGKLEVKSSELKFSQATVNAGFVDFSKVNIEITAKPKFQSLKGTEFRVDKADADDIKEEIYDLFDSLDFKLDKLLNLF